MKSLTALEDVLNIHHELARKIVHIMFGLCFLVAAAIFDLGSIPYMAGGSLVVFMFVRYYHIFPAMHKVYRRTYGELFYPIGLLVASLIVNSAREFFVCVAVLAFADSAASLAGKWWRSPAINFGSSKASVIGSATFFGVALVVLSVGLMGDFIAVPWGTILLATAILTIVEAISPLGSDNLFIPIVLALILAL